MEYKLSTSQVISGLAVSADVSVGLQTKHQLVVDKEWGLRQGDVGRDQQLEQSCKKKLKTGRLSYKYWSLSTSPLSSLSSVIGLSSLMMY